MISKKFFINQASELTKKWIRHNVSIDGESVFVMCACYFLGRRKGNSRLPVWGTKKKARTGNLVNIGGLNSPFVSKPGAIESS